MVAGVDQHARLRSRGAGQVRGHAPVGDVGVIESRLEGLVFDQQALARSERLVGTHERLLQPLDALADALRAGVVGAVGQPERDIARAQFAGDGHGVEHVRDGAFPDFRRRVAQRAVLVILVLEQVGIDGPGGDSVAGFEAANALNILDAVGQVPQNMQSQGGRDPGEFVHLAGVAELLLQRGSRRGLKELPKARARVGESP